MAIFVVRQKCGYAVSATEESSESHWFLQPYKAGLQPRDPEVPLLVCIWLPWNTGFGEGGHPGTRVELPLCIVSIIKV